MSGSVKRDDYVDYRLGVKAGQEMYVGFTLTGSTSNGTVCFNILPPCSDGAAIYVGSMDASSTPVDLPASGAYKIRVYQMGNDHDANKSGDFNIDLSIQSATCPFSSSALKRPFLHASAKYPAQGWQTKPTRVRRVRGKMRRSVQPTPR